MPLLQQVGGFTRAIAPYLPGFGTSAAPTGFGYDSASYAAWLAALLDDLDIHTALTFRGR